MEIDIEDLHEICDRLFQHLRDTRVDSVTLDVDYYWNIPKELLYNPYEEPSEMDMGQLTDDWNELQKILHPGKEPISYALVWLAAILRAVGEKIVV